MPWYAWLIIGILAAGWITVIIAALVFYCRLISDWTRW